MAKEMVLLEYDSETGEITDAGGNTITTWFGLIPFDPSGNIKNIIRLKQEGFSARDLVELKEGGLI